MNKYHNLYHFLLSVDICVVSIFCYYKQCSHTWLLVGIAKCFYFKWEFLIMKPLLMLIIFKVFKKLYNLHLWYSLNPILFDSCFHESLHICSWRQNSGCKDWETLTMVYLILYLIKFYMYTYREKERNFSVCWYDSGLWNFLGFDGSLGKKTRFFSSCYHFCGGAGTVKASSVFEIGINLFST